MSKSKPVNNTNWIQGVNGLRGLAILMVIGYHLFPSAFPGGFLGVNLFFVLSGFLTVISSCRRLKDNRFSILDFYKQRLLRIFPALILVVSLTVISCKLLAPQALRGIWIEVISIFGGFNNWWQIAENSSYFTDIASSSPFVHLWYLAIDMQFYLVWPLLFYLADLIRRKGLRGELIFLLIAIVSMIASVVFYSPLQDPSRVYYGTDTRIYALCIGAFVGYRYIYRRAPILEDPIQIMVAFVLFLVLTLCGVLFINSSWSITYYLFLPLSALVFVLMVFIASNKRYVFGLWLDNPILNWLNTHSYVLYLVHYPIIYLINVTMGEMTMTTIVISIVLMIMVTLWVSVFETIIISYIQKGGRS